MLAELFFGTNGQDEFTTKDDGVWNLHANPGEEYGYLEYW
jgi:hypothetical protein